MRQAVCWKRVAVGGSGEGGAPDSGSELSGEDPRWSAVSPADRAALELALALRDRVGESSTVTVVALGPAVADDLLREALAAGADRAQRIDGSTALDGATVAAAIAAVVSDADLVWCGDYSLDRGTGSVPAYLAGHLGASQALGLVAVDLDEVRPGGGLRVVRRLDGGRREVLDVVPPAVLSVEGSVAALRRASLAATLAARTAPIEVTAGPRPDADVSEGVVRPYRPRARVLPPPAGGTLHRVRDILQVGAAGGAHTETVVLDPPAAAARLLAQLREWGYVDDAGPG